MDAQQIIHKIRWHAYSPDHARWLCPLLLVVDAVLSGLVIWKVPCKQKALHLTMDFWGVGKEKKAD